MTVPPTSPRSRALMALAAVGLLGAACTPAEDGETSGGTGGATDDGGQVERAADGYSAGEYTATGSYTTPGGTEQLGVTLTLETDGTISALSVEPMGVNPNSKQFQGQFAGGIADVAVGRSIADLQVDKVAGSSLSSGGFNAALDAIAAEAAQG